ncbi:cellulose binding domain-containing protein [Carbonactinospora thermoautotrophica]|uniref:cellulose binding domain-containing protein n=1 Tax=Carbonactinospora thermoautotrophica TaxID=1469144 RepID=UPI003B8A6F98
MCTVTVKVDTSWQGGFQASVTIKNTGTTPIDDWYVSWTMPSGVTISQGWNGTFMQSGTTAMVHAPSWNSTLAPGATATAGFLGSNPSSSPPTPT